MLLPVRSLAFLPAVSDGLAPGAFEEPTLPLPAIATRGATGMTFLPQQTLEPSLDAQELRIDDILDDRACEKRTYGDAHGVPGRDALPLG